jgi:hypothetical protein
MKERETKENLISPLVCEQERQELQKPGLPRP